MAITCRIPYLIKSVVALLTFCAPPALFAQLPSPVLSEDTVQVSEHVHMITGFPNIVFVVGDNATLVVDTGLGPEQGAKVAGVAQRLSRGEKLYLTTTHFHPEHAAGEAGFPDGTVLIRARRQQEEMARDGATLINLFRGFGNFGPLLEGVTSLRTPDILFDDSMRLDLGGVSVRLLWLGIGHTEGDELIYVEEDRALIAGDIVQNKVVPNVAAAGGSLTNWLDLLTQLEQLSPAIVVPTHSRVGGGSLITESRAFIQDMRSRALALHANGVAAEDAAGQLTAAFQQDYPEWAANTDWNNLQTMPGFVQRVYLEAESF